MQEHEPGQVKTGLLKSKLLLDCYKLIFTGPASALPELAPGGHNKAKGKPPVINKFETPSESITIYAIIYIACLTHHALNTHSDWADDDGDFKGIIFVRTLLTTAIRDPEWRREICAWYKRRVLDQPDGREPPRNRQTAYSIMMREAIHEPQSQYDREEPEQPEEEEAVGLGAGRREMCPAGGYRILRYGVGSRATKGSVWVLSSMLTPLWMVVYVTTSASV
ncbi:hypothetical protein NUW54_g13568 [Trametes sanguinea]|uniref:Uncharacterized protein n=1 Tax=Trametes sanguinea TaxID=158606 RepID=A0ACC1MLW2_9APHY|nr:hypothetical protein NUW54_g13568 [Trametes sanguinea]